MSMTDQPDTRADHARPAYTGDAVVFGRTHDGTRCVLLIRRSATSDAYPGAWALPGGHVDLGETALAAAIRELHEETGLDLSIGYRWLEVGTYDAPGRDPRGWYVGRVYTVHVAHLPEVAGQDDAQEAEWVPVDVALGLPLAFDHRQILKDALALHTPPPSSGERLMLDVAGICAATESLHRQLERLSENVCQALAMAVVAAYLAEVEQ